MVDIKRATASAIDFAKNTLGPERTVAIRLEEIESSVLEGRDVWLITLSSAKPSVSMGLPTEFIAATQTEFPREYKIFTVSKDSGEVLSMKIRVLRAPAA